MNVDDFEREIASKDRRTIYLIVGAEPIGLRRCLAAAKAAVPEDYRGFNFSRHQAEDLARSGWSRLEPELSANPFGPPPRVVLVRCHEGDKFGAEASETLARLRPRVNPKATLVLACDSIPDARYKIFKDLAKDGAVVECLPPDRVALPQWLMERFRERGAQLTFDGAKAMIERIGTDLGTLEREAEKLSIYPGPGRPIGPDAIRRLVSLGPTAEIYELAFPAAEGRLDKALPTLLDLLERADPMPLLYAVGTHFRRLAGLAADLAAAGARAGDGELARRIGVTPAMIKRLRPQVRRWGIPRLRGALKDLEAANRAMISGSDPAMVLQELVAGLGLKAGDG